MGKQKQLKKLQTVFGEEPSRNYLAGDMNRIESYFSFRRERELCELVGGDFTQLHFSERIESGEVWFGYKLKLGAANSRNAIKLLEIMGYPKNIVAGADTRAKRYIETGVWK